MAKKPIPSWAATLKGLRKRAGLTQRVAADFCGVGLRTWERWESGSRVPPEPLRVEIGRRLGGNPGCGVVRVSPIGDKWFARWVKGARFDTRSEALLAGAEEFRKCSLIPILP